MDMNLYQFFQEALLPSPNWEFLNIQILKEEKKVILHLSIAEDAQFLCPVCQKPIGKVQEIKSKTFKYLRILDFQTQIIAEQPLIQCPKHGQQKIDLPWEQNLTEMMSMSHLI